MDTSGYTVPYVSGWAASVKDTSPVEVVKATGERVRKTALGILDRLDTMKVCDGTPPGLNKAVQKNSAHRAAATARRPPAPSVEHVGAGEPAAAGRRL
jgi:hypothetical protein